MRLRDLYWFAGAAGVAANFVSGCSSSSSAGQFGPADSGQDATAMVEDAASDAHCVIDADLSFVTSVDAAGADCAVCLVDNCQTGIRDCETDCLCGYYFACVAYLAGDAGYGAFTTCAGSEAATLASNHAVSELYSCYTTTCNKQCVPATDGGTDAGGGGTDGAGGGG